MNWKRWDGLIGCEKDLEEQSSRSRFLTMRRVVTFQISLDTYSISCIHLFNFYCPHLVTSYQQKHLMYVSLNIHPHPFSGHFSIPDIINFQPFSSKPKKNPKKKDHNFFSFFFLLPSTFTASSHITREQTFSFYITSLFFFWNLLYNLSFSLIFSVKTVSWWINSSFWNSFPTSYTYERKHP